MGNIVELINEKFSDIDYRVFPELRSSNREVQSSDDESEYYIFKELGLAITVAIKNGTIVSLIFYGPNNDEGYDGFSGELPSGADFSMSKKELCLKLGTPVLEGDSEYNALLGEKSKPFVKYEFEKESFSVHFEFSMNKKTIYMINVLSEKYWELMGY